MFDTAIIGWLQGFRSPLLDALFLLFTRLGDELFYTLFIPCLYWLVDREKAHRLGVVFLAATWLNALVKEWLAFPRPGPELGVLMLTEARGAGFPSGHAQGSLALWGWLAVEFRRPWLVALSVAMVLLVSASRLYLGVHFPVDILGGWALAALVMLAAAAVWGAGVGKRWPLSARVSLGAVVPLLLLPLQQNPASERIAGFLIGLCTVGLASLRYISYDPAGPVGQRLVRAAVGLAGLVLISLAARMGVPPGLGQVASYVLAAAWVTAVAPLLFVRWGLAEHAAELRERARQRRIRSIATASFPAMVPYLGACGALLAAVATLSVLAPVRSGSRPVAASALAGARPAIIGHRGAAGLAPENTLPAFEAALRHGATWLQLDVRRTADGALVAIHDETVDRTTNGRGAVREMTLSQLQLLDAGFHFTPDGRSFPFRGRGVTVPTLEQVLTAFPGARFWVDIRSDELDSADAVVTTLTRLGLRGRVVVASPHLRVLERLRATAPDIPTAASAEEAVRTALVQRLGLGSLVRRPSQVLSLPERYRGVPLVTEGLVRTARWWGVALHVGVVNDPHRMRYYVAMGVDGIVTDYPDRLAAVLSGRAGPDPAALRDSKEDPQPGP